MQIVIGTHIEPISLSEGNRDFPAGRVGERNDLQVLYYIYVKKDQIELAQKVLTKVKAGQ